MFQTLCEYFKCLLPFEGFGNYFYIMLRLLVDGVWYLDAEEIEILQQWMSNMDFEIYCL